jgi:DNA (cytosine-5)-methyltransferase 1
MNYGNILRIPRNIKCDVVTAGFPCQPFSSAGQRRGSADDRNLWPVLRDFIMRLTHKPAWFVFENVPNLVNMGIDAILFDVEEFGYSVQPFIVPACGVGLPQIKGERLFIVASANGKRFNPRNKVATLNSPSRGPTKSVKPWRRIGNFRGNSGRVWQAPSAMFDRMDYGISGELDRVRCLGNAVPPALVRPIARYIRQAMTQ